MRERIYNFDRVIFSPSRKASDDLLTQGTILIVREENRDKWAKFSCPCGCGQKLVVSLQDNHLPCWSLGNDRGIITLQPSVHVNGQDSCGAHFFVRNNQIEWV